MVRSLSLENNLHSKEPQLITTIKPYLLSPDVTYQLPITLIQVYVAGSKYNLPNRLDQANPNRINPTYTS
jgi:hypothetical protein